MNAGIGPAVSDPERILAECRNRVLEREGIVMVVALLDARPGRASAISAVESAARADAEALADRFDVYAPVLGDVIDTLVVLAEQHVRAPALASAGE